MRLTTRILLLALLSPSAGCGSPSRPSGTGESTLTLRVDAISPAVGSTASATAVAIRGSGFVPGTTVFIGALRLSATAAAPGQLKVSVPPQPAGAFDVVVANPNGRSVRLAAAFRFETPAPVDPVPVRLSGQVLVGESNDMGLSGATISLAHGLDQPPVSAVTDDEGRFVIDGTVERSLPVLMVSVRKSGVGFWTLPVAPATHDAVVLRLLDLHLIRAGRSLRGELTSNNALWCTFESIACLRLIVDGAPGSLVDLELIPEQGQPLGLFATESFLAPTEFPKRLTVPPGSMWLMGNYGRFTLKAHAVTTTTSR